jgi:hypothetical protein
VGEVGEDGGKRVGEVGEDGGEERSGRTGKLLIILVESLVPVKFEASRAFAAASNVDACGAVRREANSLTMPVAWRPLRQVDTGNGTVLCEVVVQLDVEPFRLAVAAETKANSEAEVVSFMVS